MSENKSLLIPITHYSEHPWIGPVTTSMITGEKDQEAHCSQSAFNITCSNTNLSELMVATNWCSGSNATPWTKLLCSGNIAMRWAENVHKQIV